MPVGEGSAPAACGDVTAAWDATVEVGAHSDGFHWGIAKVIKEGFNTGGGR